MPASWKYRRWRERFGDVRFEREAHDRLVAGAQVVRERELRQGPRRGGQSSRSVEFDEQIAVGREDELDVVLGGPEITLRLIEAVSGR